MQLADCGLSNSKTPSTFNMSFINGTLRKFCVLVTALLCLAPNKYFVDAKISSGKAHLSGAYTEATLGELPRQLLFVAMPLLSVSCVCVFCNEY